MVGHVGRLWVGVGAVRSSLLLGRNSTSSILGGYSRLLATIECKSLRGASLQDRHHLCVGLGWSEDRPASVRRKIVVAF
jgi:hypothetical protein